MKTFGVGIIGCGNISAAYLELAPLFNFIEMRAVADLNLAAAEARAAEFGVRAESVEGLVAAEDIEIVVNLTVPAAHFEVSKRILESGKNVYCEKPFVLDLNDAETLQRLAEEKGLRIGSAPDTFLGGTHQAARAALDEGRAGDIIGGSCHVMTHGMEAWHPNPDFFYRPGGGPILDMGPYYVTNLVQLIGPVRAVAAMASTSLKTRTIGNGPRRGEEIPVETPTSTCAILEFHNGALVTLSASWDVWAHRHPPMELYGTQASLFIPDPNLFGGEVQLAGGDGSTVDVPSKDHPFAIPNTRDMRGIGRANYRGAGLADMAQAVVQDRPHRCSFELAAHVVEVMTAILQAADQRAWVETRTACVRPAILTPDQAAGLLRNQAA